MSVAKLRDVSTLEEQILDRYKPSTFQQPTSEIRANVIRKESASLQTYLTQSFLLQCSEIAGDWTAALACYEQALQESPVTYILPWQSSIQIVQFLTVCRWLETGCDAVPFPAAAMPSELVASPDDAHAR